MKNNKIIKFKEIISLSYRDKEIKKINLITTIISFLILYILLTATSLLNIFYFAKLNGNLFTISSILILVGISVFTGINIALLRFKFLKIKNEKGKKNNKDYGYLAFFLSFFGTGCPVCGSLILGFFGVPLGLAVLPFKGLEINILTLILLMISTYYIGKKCINECESCKIK